VIVCQAAAHYGFSIIIEIDLKITVLQKLFPYYGNKKSDYRKNYTSRKC